MKSCVACGHTLPLDQFYADPRSKDALTSRCIPCHNADTNARHAAPLTLRRLQEGEVRCAHCAVGADMAPGAFIEVTLCHGRTLSSNAPRRCSSYKAANHG